MPEEFESLYDTYQRIIYSFILRIVNGQSDLAMELTQETFYQVMISFHRYRGECAIKTWICQIAKNTCYRYFKKNPWMLSVESEEFGEMELSSKEKSLEELAEDKELSGIVGKSVKKLKKKYRDVICYRIYFELSFAEIAALMKISENSAKVLFYRAKQKLKQELEGYIQ